MSDESLVNPAVSDESRPVVPPLAHRSSSWALSRRRLVTAGTGLGGILLLGAAARQSIAADHPHAPHGEMSATPSWLEWEPSELTEPLVVRSVDGTLSTELRVAYVYHDIGGYRLHLRGYNNGIPGPTLRVKPGDRLRFQLINDLPPNPDALPVDPDLPHHFNTTNLHVHGLHVSPEGIADNIFRVMEPGQRYDVEIAIPDDHPSGTFWYHPHRHGSADIQVTSGMAGALIIEGDFPDVPEITNAQERTLVLSEVLFDHLGTIEHYDTVWPEAVPRFLAINGQREPIIRMRPGEVQRWRFVQAAHENNLQLALGGHLLHAIAYDGIPAATIDTAEQAVIAPGQRVDVLIQAGDPGTYLLAAIPNDQGYPSPEGPLGRLVVAGEPMSMLLPATLSPPPLSDISEAELTGRRRLTLSALEPEYPPAASYQEFAFLIDNQRFDHDRVDQRVELNAVEEWTVINDHHDDHVFHIHTNPFQLTRINGEVLAAPVWRDTVIVPRNGSIAFRTRFLDFTGKLVLHCHMFNHEELGMMQVVEIVDPA